MHSIKQVLDNEAHTNSLRHESAMAMQAQEVQKQKVIGNCFVGGFALVGWCATMARVSTRKRWHRSVTDYATCRRGQTRSMPSFCSIVNRVKEQRSPCEQRFSSHRGFLITLLGNIFHLRQISLGSCWLPALEQHHIDPLHAVPDGVHGVGVRKLPCRNGRHHPNRHRRR